MTARPPASRPCGSCPYRRDVPSGVWADEEYDKLPRYDVEIGYQPPSAFYCHQQNGRLCAGWVGCHDMNESLGLRIGEVSGHIPPDVVDAALDYTTDVPLWESGAAAAAHGKAEIEVPGTAARRVIDKLHKRERKDTP